MLFTNISDIQEWNYTQSLIQGESVAIRTQIAQGEGGASNYGSYSHLLLGAALSSATQLAIKFKNKEIS